MEKKLRVLGLVAAMLVAVILIGGGIYLVRLSNQMGPGAIALKNQSQSELPVTDINEKLKDDLAHARILLIVIEDQKREGKVYSSSEEKELRQFVADLQATLEKKQLK
jgi:hypothetical protein